MPTTNSEERVAAGEAGAADVSEREGRRIVFLLRPSPAFSFALLGYALGLTPVRFADYLLAAVGMIAGTILYAYGGKLAGDVAALAEAVGP